ncbi:hypothetical protein EAG18_16880 [Pseudoalteromonas sp. J010]|nr:hypothetical protein EAG18_16880 [Pseudoalteromonas sp. J010]
MKNLFLFYYALSGPIRATLHREWALPLSTFALNSQYIGLKRACQRSTKRSAALVSVSPRS